MRRCANSLPTNATLLILLAFELLIPSVCSAQSNRRYIIGTVVGSDSGIMSIEVYRGGFSGDEGPATNALLNNPEGIAVDRAGNLYISDTLNYRIRRIDANSGVISTVAGTGAKGYSGEGSPASAAQMTTPAGIVIDQAGRIYFADLFNQRIRVLSPF